MSLVRKQMLDCGWGEHVVDENEGVRLWVGEVSLMRLCEGRTGR